MASSTAENIPFSSAELPTLPFQSSAQFNLVIPLNKISHRIVYDILRRQNLRSGAKFMQSNKKINEWMEIHQNFAAIKEHFIGEGATLYYRQVDNLRIGWEEWMSVESNAKYTKSGIRKRMSYHEAALLVSKSFDAISDDTITHSFEKALCEDSENEIENVDISFNSLNIDDDAKIV